MAESLWDWSRTAASNSNADSSVNWAEGMSPAAINNSARSMMAAVAKHLYDMSGQIVTGGTSTAFTATTTSGLGSLAEGRMLCVEAHVDCGATPTINVDTLGAKSLYRFDATGVGTFLAGELQAGGRYVLQYDTSLNAGAGGWIVLNPTIIAASIIVATDDRILGRVSGANGPSEELTVTQVLDLVDSTRGTIPYRGSSAWAGLDPSTAGFVLRDNGADADPSWVGGMTLITSGSASGVASVDLTLPSGYKAFKLFVTKFEPASATSLCWRASYDNGANYTSSAASYAYGYTYGATNATTGGSGGTNTVGFIGATSQDTTTTLPFFTETTLYPGATGKRPVTHSQYLQYTGSVGYAGLIHSWCGDTGRMTNIRLLTFSGGNMAIDYALYGII
jgi:hypothetical protein